MLNTLVNPFHHEYVAFPKAHQRLIEEVDGSNFLDETMSETCVLEYPEIGRNPVAAVEMDPPL